MDFFKWIESHGIESMAVAYIFSQITNVMPAYPEQNNNWWLKWAYNVGKVLGANAKGLVDHSPIGQKIEAQTTQTLALVKTETSTSTESPKE